MKAKKYTGQDQEHITITLNSDHAQTPIWHPDLSIVRRPLDRIQTYRLYPDQQMESPAREPLSLFPSGFPDISVDSAERSFEKTPQKVLLASCDNLTSHPKGKAYPLR